MGVNDSKTTALQNSYTFAHPLFQHAKCFKKNDEEQYIQINYALASQEQYRNWEIFMHSAPKLQSLMLPIGSHFEKNSYCGSSGIAKISYPNYQFLLSQQISNRQKYQKNLFDESQLWYLTYTIIEAAQAIHSQGYKVGDIRPNNIFLNSQGQIKLGCIYSWPGESTNYSKTYNEKQITYLAPQQIKDIQFAKIDNNPNFQIAESFSIGLTILDTALLCKSDKLYQHKSRFDFQSLENNLAALREKGYSESLVILIENLCDPEPLNRSICKNIKQWLKPYAQDINNLTRFTIDTIPQKLQKSHKRISNLIKNSHNTSIIEGFPITSIQRSSLRSHSSKLSGVIEEAENRKFNFHQSQPIGPSKMLPFPLHQKWNQASLPYSPSNKINQIEYKNPSTISHFSQSPSSFTIQINSNTQRNILSLQQIDRQLEISRKMFPS